MSNQKDNEELLERAKYFLECRDYFFDEEYDAYRLPDLYEKNMLLDDFCAFARQELGSLTAKLEEAEKALRKTDAAMAIQEKRQTGEFHIPAHTMWAIWAEARRSAWKVFGVEPSADYLSSLWSKEEKP